jgi:hypothetical protein
MRVLSALFLLFLAVPAAAACQRPGPAPALPNGAKADQAAMNAGHDAIQAYVNALEAYQSCLRNQAEQAPPDTAPQLKAAWIAQGDAAIDLAQTLAAGYSAALKQFKERTAK